MRGEYRAEAFLNVFDANAYQNSVRGRGRVLKEHVYRTQGQSQRGLGLKVVAGKWRQLYLNNN